MPNHVKALAIQKTVSRPRQKASSELKRWSQHAQALHQIDEDEDAVSWRRPAEYQRDDGQGRLPPSASGTFELKPSATFFGVQELIEDDDTRYFITMSGKLREVEYVSETGWFRLSDPAAQARNRATVFWRGSGWALSPGWRIKGWQYDSKPFGFRDPDVPEARAREMRSDLRKARDAAARSTSQALEALDAPALSGASKRLLNLFFGGSSEALVRELGRRIRVSQRVLESIRPSLEIRYRAAEGRAFMSTVYGGRPPRFTSGSGSSLHLHRSEGDAGRGPYLMYAYDAGMQDLQQQEGANYADAMRETLLHESFHVTNPIEFDIYEDRVDGKPDVAQLITHAAHEVLTKGAENVHELLLKKTLLMHRTKNSIHEPVPTFLAEDDGLDEARLEQVWSNESERGALLADILDNFAPYMFDNPDSFMRVVDGLAMLHRNPAALDDFFADYEAFLQDDRLVLDWKRG
ncbi:hypothetical protein [Caballeronia sp. LZ034LL]|uniref:hypothetical protein n=1 Tax=Caballeronia sp. LZ034LL TaxID=3038567 RepID=UPI002866C9F1|nr:hypothetical protein [Caballeronia sp. LZ034LL]MDR5839245.1 hypothetical protein [Caballeronia sp. LZ034LL]